MASCHGAHVEDVPIHWTGILDILYTFNCFLVDTRLAITISIAIGCTGVIKTHDSESRGQEEAGRTQRMSVLFTGSTAVKLVNALNKLPLKLSLSYQRLSTF